MGLTMSGQAQLKSMGEFRAIGTFPDCRLAAARRPMEKIKRLTLNHDLTPLSLPVPAAAPQPECGFLNLGAHPHPGRSLTVHSQGLVLDGQPWLPIMGELHYSRCPEAEWPRALAALRAGGVQVVASYVIWNHHEPHEGQWCWQGQRALRRFVQLAQAAGLLVYLRPGPWVHAEVRQGGFPDWLLTTGPLRCNHPDYLRRVHQLYAEVARQVSGLLWCDGGPVIGLQLENEYGATGPGCGAEHIAALKQLALDVGLRVPLYTVTGWPTLDIPPREVLPVSGAYADGFWQGERGPLPPSGVFLFNTRRVIGEMGNVDGTPAQGLIDPLHYPFCLAEAGGGMHQSYHRRPVVGADDSYATALVQIGSGANLYGYYMYHGGTNPVCSTGPLNETQASGYPNDVPQWGYDFHAPLGQYGQVRPAWGRLRLLHQLCADFGADLAPLAAVLPEAGPWDPADATQPRVALRAAGGSADAVQGFVFINHHVRHHPLPPRPGLRLALDCADGSRLRLPLAAPLNLAPGMAMVWPVGLRLGRARLRHATLQAVARWTLPDGGLAVVLAALPGVPVELALDAEGVQAVQAEGLQHDRPPGGGSGAGGAHSAQPLHLLHAPALTEAAHVALTDADGQRHRLLLLPQDQAEQGQPVWLGGQRRWLHSSHPALPWPGQDRVHLLKPAHAPGELALWPADGLVGRDGPGATGPLTATLALQQRAGLAWAVRAWPGAAAGHGPWALRPALLQAPGQPAPLRWGPHLAWRPGPVPLQPTEADWPQAGRWALPWPEGLAEAWGDSGPDNAPNKAPNKAFNNASNNAANNAPPAPGQADAAPDQAAPAAPDPAATRAADASFALEADRQRLWLHLALHGDVAQLWVDGVCVDDRFCDGTVWTVGLHRWLRPGHWPRVELAILPLDPALPVFLEAGARQVGAGLHQATLELERVETLELR